MEIAKNNQIILKLPPVDKCRTPKNYDLPEVMIHTFETLSSLHKLLPNHLMKILYSYKSEQDKKKCENSELSGLERILARCHFPREVNLTPKPSSMPLWKRKNINSAKNGWKKCYLLNKNIKDPPMSTIVVRWLKKNMKPTEDLRSVIQKLSVFGPIRKLIQENILRSHSLRNIAANWNKTTTIAKGPQTGFTWLEDADEELKLVTKST
uniref:Uncharacterized protein n=1 Tax=Rousettus aegyptiacus TaxID=9407 RepID=A0A7J8K5M5_ROUAE|nr:hypothetical protein HJG63_001905 [Rousettus aegyptiacus]